MDIEILGGEEVSLELLESATATTSAKSIIKIRNSQIAIGVNGACLECCIRCGDNYLLFTSDDCPFEETVNIYLLSRDNRILDRAAIYWPYAAGIFELIAVSEPNVVHFKFIAEKIWKLQIFHKQHLYVPYLFEENGVHRGFSLQRHFKIVAEE